MERLEQVGPVNADAGQPRPEIGIGDVENGPSRRHDAADEALDPGAGRFDMVAEAELGEHRQAGRLEEETRAERPRRRESLEQSGRDVRRATGTRPPPFRRRHIQRLQYPAAPAAFAEANRPIPS